ncbi:MFS transporter [Paenibacillus paeoniae]|uniref:MFS transporter n=1 Tax=Paenibacillus paeoniae TaxID=2292705 RepID=A0A371PH78_9BACL|nr:MFS transporter [Paenibacillus paeoniae]REK75580.1 MFS transporter [Paenibacillus paeoniae]
MYRSWTIYLLAFISFLAGTSEYIIAGILDKISATHHISVASAGQLITVFSVSFGIGTPLLIALTSRMDRKKLLVYSLIVFSIFNGLIAFFSAFELLLVSRIISGLSAGVIEVTLLTIATRLASPSKQGSAIATIIIGFSTALVLGVPLGRSIASTYDWRLIFIGLSILGLLFLILITLVIPRMKAEEFVPLRKQFMVLKERQTTLTLLAAFLWMGTYSIMYSYISPFMLSVVGIHEQWISTSLFVFGIASLMGSKLGGLGTDHWGVSRTLVIGMSLHLASLLLLIALGQFVVAFFILFMLWGLAAWSSGPPLQYKLITLNPGATSIILSLFTSVSQLGMATGAGLGGLVIQHSSLSYITWVGAAGIAISLMLSAIDRSPAVQNN